MLTFNESFKKVFGLKTFKALVCMKEGCVLLQLSSKQIMLTTSQFIVGLTSKFSTRQIGQIASVRGISKNPVDHPNGGRANTKGSFKTP